MRFLGLDWTGLFGFGARVGLFSWLVRWLVALGVVLVLGFALKTVLLLWRRRSLVEAHWTERARAYWPMRKTLNFFLCLLLVSGVGIVPLGYEPVTASPMTLALLLSILISGSLLWRLRVDFEVAIGALRRPASMLREFLGVSLVFGPALWLVPVIVLTDVGSTALGFWLALAASGAYLLFAGFGGVALLARKLGLLSPAREAVVASVRRAAAAMDHPMPPTYELAWSRANAAALPSLGWVFFTSDAANLLSPARLEAVAAHELGHLHEPRRVRVLRGCSSLAWLPLVAGLLKLPQGEFLDLLFGFLGSFLLLFVYAFLQRKLEHDADHGAHAVQEEYAAALEELYRANLAPAVVRGGTHPSLFDRMIAAGKTPDYPRPEPPTSWPLLLLWPVLVALLLLAHVVAFALASSLMPMRDSQSDWAFYAAAALEGGNSAERAVLQRLREQGRIRDAIALVRAEEEGSDQERLSNLLWLELDSGDCASAAQTVARMKPPKRQRASRQTLRAFCPQ